MALTESLCTQSIQASGPALLAQASGTVQIMAYLISPMVCLIPPHLHLSIIVWMIWPLPTTTGTHTDTPITGTSGTETDLWVRHVDFLHCFFRLLFSLLLYSVLWTGVFWLIKYTCHSDVAFIALLLMTLFQIYIFKSGLSYIFVHCKARESKGRVTRAFTAA